ncbi:hypothetical protein Goklo_013547, partial [Gossypium klotzschianum]|nr:hypothetical protein [Gossypium klotzschianum]
MVKINYDTVYQAHSLNSCTRLVARGLSEHVIGIQTIKNDYIPSVCAIEALACIQAVNMGAELRLRDLTMEGNARTITANKRRINRSRSAGDRDRKNNRKETFCWVRWRPTSLNKKKLISLE